MSVNTTTFEYLFHDRKAISPATVGRAVGMEVKTVLRHIHAGRLGAIDVSKPGSARPTYRVTHQQLVEWMESITVKGGKKPAKAKPSADVPQHV